MEYKKYETFEDIYKDYKDIIDTEFAHRHIHRLTQIRDSIENREMWMKAHIMQSDGSKNQYFYKKAELLEEVYDIVDKELNLSIPYNSMIDEKIREVKNKIVDNLFTGRMSDYRSGQEWNKAMRRAGMLADIIEYAIKGFLYSKEIYNNDELIKTIDEGVEKNCHKETILNMVKNTIDYRDSLKIMAQLGQCIN